MDNAAKARVLGLRREVGVDFVAFTVETELKPVWIVRAADETVASVGKLLFAHFMKTLKRRPTR